MTRLLLLATIPAALVGAAGATAAAAASAEAPPAVQQAFGNTILSTYPDGRQARLWLRPGGDYTAMGRRGDRSSGHWRIKGEQLCLKQSRPMPVWFSYCTPIPTGQTWTAKAVTGERIRVKLVHGSGPA